MGKSLNSSRHKLIWTSVRKMVFLLPVVDHKNPLYPRRLKNKYKTRQNPQKQPGKQKTTNGLRCLANSLQK